MRVPAALLLATYLGGCVSWQVQSASPVDVLGQQQPTSIRLTRADHSHLVLYNPAIQADTIYGTSQQPPAAGQDPQRQAVALADITQVAVRQGDGTKTGLLVFGGLVLVGGVIAFAIWYNQMANAD